jgi:hypothetical protein
MYNFNLEILILDEPNNFFIILAGRLIYLTSLELLLDYNVCCSI